MLLAWDTRLELQARSTFGLVAPQLTPQAVDGGTPAWAYASPRSWAKRLEASYRPSLARAEPARVAPLSAAPDRLRAALETARQTLLALGYREGGRTSVPIDDAFVVALAFSYGQDGEVVRVGVHLGASRDGRYDPQRSSLAANLPDDPDCAADPAEVVAELLSLVPAHDPGEASE
jgi:hypothetical protein